MAVGGALFGNPSRAGGSNANTGPTNARALVEFKAGKMKFDTTTKMVTPDNRKGWVYIEQGEEDSLMHFKWKERTGTKIEDDLIIFPDDIEFKKVAACTTGRVYVLKFKSSSKRMFFWLQEPKEDKDEEHCKKVNDLLNNPPAPGSARAQVGGGGGSGGGLAGALAGGGVDLANLGDSDLQSLLSSMDQQQLMNLFGSGMSGLLGGGTPATGRQRAARRNRGGGGSSDETPAAAATTTSSSTSSMATPATTTSASTAATPAATTSAGGTTPASAVQLSDLQSILSGIKVPVGEGGEAAGGPAVDLGPAITAEVMKPLLEKPDFVKKMKELLPEEQKNAADVGDEIKGTIQSPQFQQALSLFCSAFQSGQLAPLIREFDLGDEAIAAAAAGNMEAFVKALEEKQKKDKKPEPEGMELD